VCLLSHQAEGVGARGCSTCVQPSDRGGGCKGTACVHNLLTKHVGARALLICAVFTQKGWVQEHCLCAQSSHKRGGRKGTARERSFHTKGAVARAASLFSIRSNRGGREADAVRMGSYRRSVCEDLQ